MSAKRFEFDSRWHRAANCSTDEILPHWRFGHRRLQGVFSALPGAVSSLTSAVVCWGYRQHDGHQWGTEVQGHAVTYTSASPTWLPSPYTAFSTINTNYLMTQYKWLHTFLVTLTSPAQDFCGHCHTLLRFFSHLNLRVESVFHSTQYICRG